MNFLGGEFYYTIMYNFIMINSQMQEKFLG